VWKSFLRDRQSLLRIRNGILQGPALSSSVFCTTNSFVIKLEGIVLRLECVKRCDKRRVKSRALTFTFRDVLLDEICQVLTM
jgi:hypothetical protein